MKQKILMVSYLSGLSDSEYSGGQIRSYEFIRRLCMDDGFELTILIGEGDKRALLSYFKNDPNVVASINFIHLKSSIFFKREWFRLMRAWSYIISFIHFLFIRKRLEIYDIGYAASEFIFDLYPFINLKKTGKVKSLSTIIYHRYPSPNKRKGFYLVNWLMFHLQNLSLRLIVKYSNFVFLLDSIEGKKLQDILSKYGLKIEPYFITIGINDSFLDMLGKTEKKYDAVHIGMRPNKGIFDIPDIWHVVVSNKKNAKLALIGRVSEEIKNKLEEEFVRLGIQENVIFLGFVDEKRKYELFSESNLFIAPSHEEGWGIAVGEAMLYGLPVVAYQLEVYESIYGDAIEYVPCFDKVTFGKCITDLLNSTLKIEALKKAGKEKASEYTWEKALQMDLKVLKKC